MKPSIISEAELAKNSVIQSPLDQDTKRNLVQLITKSAMATNGITQEEKIQALTECMACLAAAMGTFMSQTTTSITDLNQKYDEEHPKSKLEQVQKMEHQLHEVEEYRNNNGIMPNIRIDGEQLLKPSSFKMTAEEDNSTTIIDKVFKLLEKPYIWIFGAFAVCSPYAADVITTIVNLFK